MCGSTGLHASIRGRGGQGLKRKGLKKKIFKRPESEKINRRDVLQWWLLLGGGEIYTTYISRSIHIYF